MSQVNLRLLDNVVRGSENDLSAFGVDLSKWNTVGIKTVDKNISITLDGEEIFSTTYNRSAGRVVGLHFMFFGSGSVREVKLFDKNGASFMRIILG